jgi:hypothetical protein
VPILPAAILVKFKRATADFFFKIRVRMDRDVSELGSDWLFWHWHSSSLGLKASMNSPVGICNVCRFCPF